MNNIKNSISREECVDILNWRLTAGKDDFEKLEVKYQDLENKLREIILDYQKNKLPTSKFLEKAEDFKKQFDSLEEKLQVFYLIQSDIELLSKEPIEDEISINDLDLSSRTFNALSRYGFYSLKQIARMTEKDLRGIRNLGKMGRDEVIEKLTHHGYKIKGRGV